MELFLKIVNFQLAESQHLSHSDCFDKFSRRTEANFKFLQHSDTFLISINYKIKRNLTDLNLFINSFPEGLLYRSLFSLKTFLLLKTEFTALWTQAYMKLYRIENLQTKFQSKTERGLLL